MRMWIVGLMLALAGALVVAGLIVAVATSNETTIVELDAGDCFELSTDGDTEIGEIEVIDCSAPHNAEVIDVGELNPDRDLDYPPDGDLFDEVDRRCAGKLGDAADEFGMLPVAPNEASWEPLAGRYVCVAVPYGGGPVTGSIAIEHRA